MGTRAEIRIDAAVQPRIILTSSNRQNLLINGLINRIDFSLSGSKSEARNPKLETISNDLISNGSKQESLEILNFENSNLFRISIFEFRIFKLQILFGSGYAGLGYLHTALNKSSANDCGAIKFQSLGTVTVPKLIPSSE